MLKLISCFFLFFILIQCEWSVGQNLKLKDGFSISELKYENNTQVVIPSARSMVLSPSGILFVACFNFTGLSNPNGTNYPVLAIQFNDNYTVKRVVKVTHELHVANGVAFHNGSLYVALIDRVYRYDDVESHLDNAPLIQSSQIMGPELLPNKTHHGWRYIRFGPDNKLYLAVGAPCNVPGDSLVNCVNDTAQPYFGTIVRMDPDGKNPEIYAKGIRNSVGFDWHPTTKELWFTDNGRDNMDQPDHNLMPPDELNRVTAGGQNFGFPHCYGKNISDVQFPDNCSNYIGAEVELGPHVAAIGMRFYNHSYFPGYKNAVFIAEHGSWNRNPPIGYRITVVTTVEGNLKYDNFITGWLSDPLKSCETDSDCGETSYCLKSSGAPYCAGFGRPSDVEVLNDGSILISDETRSRIYRVTYSPTNPVPTNWIVWLIAGVAAGLLLIIVIIVISCTLVQPRNNYENV